MTLHFVPAGILILILHSIQNLQICKAIVLQPPPSCPSNYGYVPLPSCTCIKPVHSETTWDDANADCFDSGGRLLVVDTEAKAMELTTYTKLEFAGDIDVWIGVLSYSSNAPSSHQYYGTFVWSDCSDVVYSNWAPGKPSSSVDTCGVHLVDDGEWDDSPCTMTKKYVCEHIETRPSTEIRAYSDNVCAETPTTTTTVPASSSDTTNSSSCPTSEGYFSLTSGLCVLPFHSELSWSEASSTCQDIGGRLPIVDNEEKSSDLVTLINQEFEGGEKVWIGLVEYSSSAPTSHQFSKKWIWTDCRQLNFSDWGPNQPRSNNYKCCAIRDGQWYDNMCSHKFVSICEKIATRPSPEILQDQDDVCPESPITSSTTAIATRTSASITGPTSTLETSSTSALETNPTSTLDNSPTFALETGPTSAPKINSTTALETTCSPTSAPKTDYTTALGNSRMSTLDSNPTSALETTSTSALETSPMSAPKTNSTSALDNSSTSALETRPTSALETSPMSALETSPTPAQTTFMSTNTPTTSNNRVTREVCTCFCINPNRLTGIDKNALEKKTEEIKKELLVDTKNLTSTQMKYKSRADERKSSQNIGAVGITMIVVPFALMVFADVISVF